MAENSCATPASSTSRQDGNGITWGRSTAFSGATFALACASDVTHTATQQAQCDKGTITRIDVMSTATKNQNRIALAFAPPFKAGDLPKGTPEIVNTDQGSQFTSAEFTDALKANGIRISMDEKGCWQDNVFVKRPWRTVKYEEVYLKAYDIMSAAKASLGTFFDYYNPRRPRQSLDDKTPDAIYFAALPQKGAYRLTTGLPTVPLASRIISQQAAVPWIALPRKTSPIDSRILSKQTGPTLASFRLNNKSV